MSSDPFDESLVQGVCDPSAEANPQRTFTPPAPSTDLGNPRTPRQPVSSCIYFVLRNGLTLDETSTTRSCAVLPFSVKSAWRPM